MAMRSTWVIVPAAIVASISNVTATQYFSIEEAQKLLFSDADRFEAMNVTLSKEQMAAITNASKITARNNNVNVWQVKKGEQSIGTFWVDHVIGKHEFITYAVGLGTDGHVTQIEIMDYRETYGYQVREKNWKKQFVGKKAADKMKLGDDVLNISGATLSCRNITDGIKRILVTNNVIFKN